MKYSEMLRPNDVFKGYALFIQDFIAPFYIWKKPTFQLEYLLEQNSFSIKEVLLKSQIFKPKNKLFMEAEICIKDKGISSIKYNDHELISIQEA
jgi:hypothetical protein